ncbi:MAG: hypothetical protein NTY33_01405 [Candidatus Moranbacteria bacterium]|nr:hypothetical protein [Candidatus Moranbacteria bacterium]
MKKSLVTVGVLLAIVLFSVVPCFGEEQNFSAAWIQEAGVFRIFSLQVGSDHFEADFSVSVGNSGEIYFSLISAVASYYGTNYSSWDGEAICTPVVNLGSANSFWMKLKIVSNNGSSVFKLSDWYVNGPKNFGPAFPGGDLEKISIFSNVAMICGAGNTVQEIAVADSEAIDLTDMKALIVVSGIMFYAEYDWDGTLIGIHLYSDYKERLQYYASFIKQKDKIRYAYIFDEPELRAFQCGISLKEMLDMVDLAIDAVNQVFPGVVTVGVMATTKEDLKNETVFGFTVSANAYAEYRIPKWGVVGIDVYPQQLFLYDGCGDCSMQDFFNVWSRYMENLKNNMLSGQKILLVPGTYEADYSISISTEDHLAQLDFFREKAQDSRVEIVMPFLWKTTGSTSRGLSELPAEVLQGWEDFGRELCGK